MSTSSSSSPSLGEFVARHIGVRPEDQAKMLAEIGYASLDDLIDAAVPAGIRSASRPAPTGGGHRGGDGR